jgi:hypothetical protein
MVFALSCQFTKVIKITYNCGAYGLEITNTAGSSGEHAVPHHYFLHRARVDEGALGPLGAVVPLRKDVSLYIPGPS